MTEYQTAERANPPRPSRRLPRLGCGLLVLLSLSGCHLLQKNEVGEAVPAQLPDLSGVQPPQKLVAIWSDTTYHHPGAPATRGLGGRLYFYDAARKTVQVNGQLIVYGYDDSKSGPESREPDRKYVITPAEFARHHSTTDIGSSYSVWIPWDEVGGEQKKISVVPVFTTLDGHVIMGDHARHLLPGSGDSPTTSDGPPQVNPSASVRLADYQDGYPAAERNLGGQRIIVDQRQSVVAVNQTVPEDHAKPRLRATSIALPPTVRQRLMNSASLAENGRTTPPTYGNMAPPANANYIPAPVDDGRSTQSYQLQTTPEQSFVRPAAVSTYPSAVIGETPAIAPPPGPTTAPVAAQPFQLPPYRGRLPLARSGLATLQAQAAPAAPRATSPLATSPYPAAPPSHPAWQPGYPNTGPTAGKPLPLPGPNGY